MKVTGLDGVEREIAVTAFPLFAHADEFVGMVAILGSLNVSVRTCR